MQLVLANISSVPQDVLQKSKNIPSQSLSAVRKKVTFLDQVSSDIANTESNVTHADQLINLNDEEQTKTQSNFSSCTPENDQLSRKYSEDLLSLDFVPNQSTTNFQGIGDSNEFRNELENCINLLDFVGDQSPQTNSSELQFWSLMENLKSVGDNSPLIPDCEFNQNENRENSTFSYLENVLNEFDPFSGEKASCFQSKVVNENC
ncbi:hypothetical protein TNIN_182041 [Trichonephila inaurata madagascariensis]|uniref:Uncharacterized protein n=1 Tax=Trichonephila inaurata madagascariensis TaxID=2747483 RepID=A0A8X6X4J3_9ARAC|nr:hypothetical protein TNIN_182041 [Trichonephila inaurata madagascariensis]